MASIIDVSGLTLNPKESTEFQKFVFERMYDQPEVSTINAIWDGVKMNEQIVFAGLMGKSGIKDTACTRPNSGATSALTQKNWLPTPVGDTLVHCQVDVDALFKAYYDKIKTYEDKFDITGSEEEKFIATVLTVSASDSLRRLVWFGDPSVAVAGAATAGLTAAGNVQYYDSVTGLWSRIFTGVAAADISRYTITENTEIIPASQLLLAAGRSIEIFEAMWASADPRLRADPNKNFMVSHGIWENYRKYLQSKGENYTIELTTNGLPSLKWNGVPVIDMEMLWDLLLLADFWDNSTNEAYYLPNRAILTVKENIPIATLNKNNFDSMESWYERKERQNYMAYGYTLDTLYLEGYMIEVAY